MLDSNQDNIAIQDSVPNYRLPNILSVKAKRINYSAPKLKYFTSSLANYDQAIEIIVTTDAPIPIRADMPVLYIGEARTIEVEAIDEKTYRFLVVDITKLNENDPIAWQWMMQPGEKPIPTKFRFSLE
ncbi:hypothetical protein [Spirosoma luteum]|uniref:hypothetical protein n=1 Tax=Spirosoma luteum TaxID=431553 RepID=UPI0003732F89|nr:hypothetical protein [Spirosoma luteum]